MQLKDQFNKEKTSHRTVSGEGGFDFLLSEIKENHFGHVETKDHG